MRIRSIVKGILIEQQNKKYQRQLSARRMTYPAWLSQQRTAVKDETQGEQFICFMAPEGKAAEGAIEKIACYFAEHPNVQLLYGDEDVWEGEADSAQSPWFKPDWSPDLFRESFYFGSLIAVRTKLWQKYGDEDVQEHCCTITDFAHFQEQIRNCVCAVGGYAPKCNAIGHVREIVFHSNSVQMQQRYLQINKNRTDANKAAEFTRNKEPGKVLLSIVIPSKDQPEILQNCLKAIPKAAGSLSYEVLVVDNGSKEVNRCKIEAFLQEMNLTYLYQPMEFHFSRMCNLGAEHAKGNLVLFLNDDVELVEAGCLERMAQLALQEYTGAVGCKLYYPDSVKIQHAGITNLPMGPVHKLQFLEDDISYYFNSNRGCRNVLAVTAACLMLEKEKFQQAGGFAEELRVAFNDVDLCYTLYEQGYHNVCRNDFFAYHHESLSRGDDESAEKLQRLLQERAVLYKRHPQLEGVDPYFGAGLAREGLDTRIRAAYETAGNHLQVAEKEASLLDIEIYRQDACVMFRVEDSTHGQIHGFGVVLGDNNACYEKRLIFREQTASVEGTVYAITPDLQYRPDLIENMPDQENVGLSGFWVALTKGALPAGNYRIGMAVRNRVTGLRLMNWSNRVIGIK